MNFLDEKREERDGSDWDPIFVLIGEGIGGKK